MAAMITTRAPPQGRNATHKHLHRTPDLHPTRGTSRNAIHKHLHPTNEPEAVTEDETSVIQKLLDEYSRQAEEDIKNGIWHTTEDAWITPEKYMGWDTDFFRPTTGQEMPERN